MREAIKGFYQEWFELTPVVTKYYEHPNETAVTLEDFDQAVDWIVYKIELKEAFRVGGNLCSQSSMTIIGWTGATFNFTPSCSDVNETLWSDPPLSG